MKMLPNLYWELPAGVQPPQGLKQQQEETPAAPGVSSPGTTMIMIMTTTMMIVIIIIQHIQHSKPNVTFQIEFCSKYH